jgi:hypothetical protein
VPFLKAWEAYFCLLSFTEDPLRNLGFAVRKRTLARTCHVASPLPKLIALKTHPNVVTFY